MVRWQPGQLGPAALIMRGTTYIELMVVVTVLALLAGMLVIPAYRSYQAARAPTDAAATLAQDLALLERTAQNGIPNEGASLIVVSADPLVYRCYRGRPASVDPNSALGALLVERHFPTVALSGGPIGVDTPLLFASNGSAQYVASGVVASQHATIALSLAQLPTGRTSAVSLNLFTGAIALP